jgi:ribonuclease BN (tRNA processing enzyme)
VGLTLGEDVGCAPDGAPGMSGIITGVRRLVVLGASGGRPTDRQACSGFLIDWDGVRVVLDLGYATLPQLLRHVPDGGVDAVVVTHEHPDHCVDLHGLYRVRHYSHPDAPRLPLFCPPGVLDRLAGLEPGADLADVFAHRPLPGTYDVGPFHVVAVPLAHFVPTVGVRLSVDHTVVAYATDTGPHDALGELGSGADVYIVDATDRPGETERAERNLLTATEAGVWAQRAGARRLVLTHLWPGTDPATSIARARRSFTGPVHVAVQGLTIELAP